MLRTGLLVGAVVLLAGGVFALSLALRADAAFPVDSFAVGGALLAGVAAAAVGLTRRHDRRLLDDLRRRAAAFRDISSPRVPGRPADAEGGGTPLAGEIEALGLSYRHALDTVVKSQEALARLRGLDARQDGEKGHSHSFIHPGGFLRSGRLIARLTPSLHWLSATTSLQRLLGRGLAELNGRSFLESIPAADVPGVVGAAQEALREGEGHDITFRVTLPGGEERHLQMDLHARYTEQAAPLHLRCHFTDVTDRVRAEREVRLQSAKLARANALLVQSNAGLQRLKESYRDLYHKAPVLYFSVDPRGHFSACNDTMLGFLGYGREELHGRPYTLLLTPEGLPRHGQDPGVFQRAGEVETRWVKKDGSVIDVWVRTTPLLDEAGRFVRSRSAAQDVTERNRLADALRAQAREVQAANERLRRINQELEEFTYVVSHDLKEPLRTLEAFSAFLRQDCGEALGADGRGHINHLVEASRRLGCLIDDLLALSRAGKIINTPRTFDLGEAVDTVLADLSDLVRRRGASVRVEGPLPRVFGDRERLVQLLTNLVVNGLKYNQSERPEVVVGAAADAGGARGDVTVFVRDNGIGIEPRYHGQIFRLFRRLHRREEYEGNGAGLAICKKIVEAHGGRIWVESEPGRGATFRLTLPRSAAAARRAPAFAPEPAAENGTNPPGAQVTSEGGIS